ncbi:hypothetical protein GYMLUDRAFT_52331 [Collybiopsis luxurians FD-317 M1]|nr:hypothetical protein GYMLUDRAFT_52331 [Collybiopsis luxurians FD-317 M1]
MEKPVLYMFGASVWSAAAELAAYAFNVRVPTAFHLTSIEFVSAELFPEGTIEYKTVNLLEGENFAPSFISKNPNATLPTLEAEGQIFTSTADVISYFLKKSSTSVKGSANAELIEILHSDKLDPNFALLLSRDDQEMKTKSGLATTYLGGRHISNPGQAALNNHSALPEAEVHRSFYEEKIASNGAFLALFQDEAPQTAKDEFFSRSQAHFKEIKEFFNGALSSYLPSNGFIGGNIPGEDDYHLCAWITRIAASLGAKKKEEAIPTFENSFEVPIPPKIASYWQAWTERPSWNKVYPELR